MRREPERIRSLRRGLAAATVLGSLVLSACGEERTIAWDTELTSIQVRIVQGDRGAEDSRLQLGGGSSQPFTVDFAFLSGADGSVMPRSGWVRVSARPGVVTLGQGQNVNGRDVYLQDGRATGIQVALTLPFGPTHIWAEDAGYLPPTGAPSGCSDQVDNDGDGLTDYPFDPGCLDSLDDSEEAGTLAAGVSETIWYDNPTLTQVQGSSKVSPFQGETVTITKGDIIVTQVASDGMYVTDISQQDGTYNSIYVYNYNTPAHVRVCDRLTNLSGIVSEFYKFTEMNFPSWELEPWYAPAVCPVRTPHTITAAELKSSTTMEGFESSLVRVENVQLGNKDCQDADPNDGVCWCDLDGNGSVDVIPYDAGAICSEECACRKTCENNHLCTERAQFGQFKQWVVSVGGQRLFIVSSETVPDFDPFAPGTPTQIRSITGTLRNMSFLKPAWILEPRCSDDIVLAGDPPPVNTTCVYPRTGEEDDEY